MKLGAFSVSLAVKDLAASKRFYEKLGFEPFGGDPQQNWLILKNGDHVLGLFQGFYNEPFFQVTRGDLNRQLVG